MPEINSSELISIRDSAARKLSRMRNFRKQYDEQRLGFYKQYLGKRDPSYFPDRVTPRSNTFIKYPYSNVETLGARVSDAFFSYWPWFETRGSGAADDAGAESMQLVLTYMLRKSGFIQAFETFVQNVLIYGHAGIKVDWDRGYDMVNYAEPIPAADALGRPILDGNTGQPIILGYKPAVKPVLRMCPKFYAIDVYDLLVDPDGGLSAHMVERTWGELRREAEANPDRYLPEAIQTLSARLAEHTDADSVILRLAELWDEINDQCTLLTYGDDKDAISYKDARYAFRAASYTPYKRKVYGGEPVVLWSGPIEFAHKRSPILHTSYSKLPGEVCGLGAVEIISDQVESLNRSVNMIQDNWNLGINSRFIYSTDADIDHDALNNANTPGGKVSASGDITKALMPLPVHKPSAEDYQIIGLMREVIEMSGGISDYFAKGIGSSGGNDTATGISSVISETNYKFRMFIRNLELDVIQPALKMCASMVQQYITDEIEVQITDGMPVIEKYPRIAPEKLIGQFDFQLVAANYVSNKVVRQRNLLAFANWGSQSPYWEQYGALTEMAKAFEIPNVHKMLKPPQQVAAEQQQAQSSQMQLSLLEKLLDYEGKAMVAEVGKKEPNKVTDHGIQVQKYIEAILQQGGVALGAPPPTQGGNKEGRPRGIQQEGKIPGAGETTPTRDFAQAMGSNAMGLEGLGGIGT